MSVQLNIGVMSAKEPDFASYSTAELREVLDAIDRARYPDRVTTVRDILSQRSEDSRSTSDGFERKPDKHGKSRKIVTTLSKYPWIWKCIAVYFGVFGFSAITLAIAWVVQLEGYWKFLGIAPLFVGVSGSFAAVTLFKRRPIGFLFASLFFLPQTIAYFGESFTYDVLFGISFGISTFGSDGLQLVESSILFLIVFGHYYGTLRRDTFAT